MLLRYLASASSLRMISLLIFQILTGVPGAADERVAITVTGSSTLAPVLLEMAKAYEAKTQNVRVDVQTGGSSKGLADARSGKADIGMVSRARRPDETDLKWTLVANDGLAIIVHKSNPLDVLSAAQVRALYRGEITDWAALGGKAGPVTLVHKAEGRSTLEVFLEHFKLKNPEIKPHTIVGENMQGIQTVAANPTAIGYVSIGSAETAVADGVAIKLLPHDGIAATTANVANNSYPLRRELNVVSKEPVSAPVAEFLKFVTSKEAFHFITEQGFVPPAN